jgi:hypothetical protein
MRERRWFASIPVFLLASAAFGAPDSLAKARKLMGQAEFAQAEAVLMGLRAEKPEDTEVLLWLGRAALEAGHPTLGLEALQAAVHVEPKSADLRYWLGDALERSGRLGEALDAYRGALALAPGHRAAHAAVEGFTVREPVAERFPHHAVALEVEGDLAVDRQQATVVSPHIHDYTFSSAPTDWIMELGDWRVRSRWSCTPSWNFMGGESPQVAAIWNKREFLGDLTVEAYMSYKMNVLGEGGYRNGTDFNVTLCGDGRNLSSGYSFIIGGWGNSWTRILKGTQVLAETNAPEHRPVTLLDGSPGSWAWHRRWWEVRAVKRGGDLYLFFDNTLVLHAVDPDPLPGGRVALWTFDNGIMIPRVKIYYQHERTPEGRGQPPYAPHVPAAEAPPAGPPLTFTSATHPSFACDFDRDLGGWQRRDGQHGALLALDADSPDESGRCLRLANEYSGGTFGATAFAGPLDAVRMNRLRFDYRVPESVKVNLQLTAAGSRYEVVFTAPEYPSDSAARLARLPDVQTDNRWHHAELDLLACLRRFLPDAPTIPLTDVWFGLDTTRDYILAGFGGNPALAEYRLDNFALLGAGPAEGTVQVAAAPAADGQTAALQYDVAVGDSTGATLDGQPDSADGVVALTGLGDGLHTVLARTLAADGTIGPTCSYPVLVDSTPPQVAAVGPSPEAPTNGEAYALLLQDPGAGVDPRSLALSVNGAPCGPGRPGFAYDPTTGEARLLPGRVGVTLEPGRPMQVTVERCTDWLGNALAAPAVLTFAYDRTLDDEPPPPPVVALPRDPLCDDDFERDLGAWAPYAATIAAGLTLDGTTAASGRQSLRVYNPASGGVMGAMPYPQPFDAGVYRLVSFDYKLRPEVRIDLYAVTNGTGHAVKFSNNDAASYIGAIPDVQLDDRWHHAEVNLYELLRAAAPTAPGYLTTLIFMDAGSYGNIQHQYYNLDNFALRPVQGLVGGADLAVAVGDPSGVAGLSYLLTTDPTSEPPTSSTTSLPRIALPALPAAESWLHVKAVDGAGNWSPTSHERLLCDMDPPSASAASPADGAVTAVSQTVLSLSDSGPAGIDPRSIRLDIAGVPYTVDNAGLVYNAASGQLTWNCERTSGGPVVFANGQSIPVKLLAAADYAGNSVSGLPAWSWTMDYAQDKAAPALASLSSGTHATLAAERFEAGVGQMQPYGSQSSATVTHEAGGPDGGGHCVKVTNAAAGGNMSAYLYPAAIATASYPWLSFDYCLSPEVTLDLLVYFYNEVLVFQLNGNAGGYFASVPGIVADGQWHHCTFNLYESIAQRAAQRGLGAYYTTSYLAFSHRDAAVLPEGAAASFDNLVISAPGPQAGTFAWSCTDTTGVAGYSSLIDASADTEPPATVTAAAAGLSFADRPSGLTWFHVRAVDGAGNWGPTSHWAVQVQ